MAAFKFASCCCAADDKEDNVKVTQLSSVTSRAIEEELCEDHVTVIAPPLAPTPPKQIQATAGAFASPEPAPAPIPQDDPPPAPEPPKEEVKPEPVTEVTNDVAPGGEFEVTVSRAQGLGMGLLLIDAKYLVVAYVSDGSSTEWNAANPGRRIKPSDRLMTVNGTDDVEEMIKASNEDMALTVTLRRRMEFAVTIKKQSQKSGLGIRCSHDESSVMVAEIKDGPFKEWNMKYPAREVKVQDRIAGVNGVLNDAEKILDTLQSAVQLDIIFLRHT